MDQEVYYNIAKDTMVQCVLLLQMMVTILNAHHFLLAFVVRWQETIDTGIVDAVAAVHVKVQEGTKMMYKLLLLLRWVKAYGEIALLYAEDLTVFICHRSCFHQCPFCKLVDINYQDCYTWFGVSNSNLKRLFKHWRVPATLYSATSHHVYGGEECLIFFVPYDERGSVH
jgi:hypothetical protein